MSIDARPSSRSTEPARKFLFDRPFSASLEPNPVEEQKKPVYTEEQLEAARRAAYDSGFAAGQKVTAEERERRTVSMIEKIEQGVGSLFGAVQRLWDSQNRGMQDVALAISRRILPAYVAKHGLGEIEATISEIVGAMAREPRLVVRVGEAQFETISERMKAITEREAYDGKIVILADPSLGPADCRVEWADGGIERRDTALWEAVERVVGESADNDVPTQDTEGVVP